MLTLDQGCQLLRSAHREPMAGLYVAFPFLTGVRPSEQLALRWSDIDLKEGTIAIRRSREILGKVNDLTKTEAAERLIPIGSALREMLLVWQQHWQPYDAENYIFRTLGSGIHQPGRPLLYSNFLRTYWRPYLARLGLPPVTPHAARHWFISSAQAMGVEVGLVSKVVGHTNPALTLGVYTHSVRPMEAVMKPFDALFSGR